MEDTNSPEQNTNPAQPSAPVPQTPADNTAVSAAPPAPGTVTDVPAARPPVEAPAPNANADKPANPYLDQQVLPGQVIGYNVPTDQKVFSQPPPNAIPPKKKHPILIGVSLLVVIAVAAAAYLFLFK